MITSLKKIYIRRRVIPHMGVGESGYLFYCVFVQCRFRYQSRKIHSGVRIVVMSFKNLLLLIVLAFSSLLLTGCGETANNSLDLVSGPVTDDPVTDDPADDPVATTDFAVTVTLPAGSTVVDNGFDPLGWMFNKAIAVDEAVTGLNLANFEVRLYDPDGDGLDGEDDFELVEIPDGGFIDNGDGTYFISVPGDPRIDCILVSVLEVDSEAVELQVPASSEGSQAEPLEINYASTAATTQYIESVVEAGSFDENLSPEEVTELVEQVADQVSSVVIDDSADTDGDGEVSIEETLAALEASASNLVDAQLELATAPPPESDLLAGIAGNYYASFFGRAIFDNDDGSFGEEEVIFEDYVFTPDGQVNNPLPITVDEDTNSATITLSTLTETYFGTRIDGSAGGGLTGQEFFGQEAFTEDEQIPAQILTDGTLVVNPGTGTVNEGFIFDDSVDRYYFAEINNSLNFDLVPWGTAYVGSAYFRYDEYSLNDPQDATFTSTCLGALGLTESELAELSEEAFDELLAGIPDAASILVSDCEHNGVGSEVLGLTFAKQPGGLSISQLAGDWGVVGIEALRDPGIARGVFSYTMSIDEAGTTDESNYNGFFAWYQGDDSGNWSVAVEADTLDVTGASASVSDDGIITFDYTSAGDDDIFQGFVSSDRGLMYAGGAAGCCSEDEQSEGFFEFGEAYSAYMVPLGTGNTAASLDGNVYELFGLSFSLEGGLETGSGLISANHDSNAGITLEFGLNSETQELEATLGGSSDLGLWDVNYGQGVITNVDVTIEMDDPADGTFPVTLTDNGAFTVRIDGEGDDGEDLFVQGFIDANGRLLMGAASGNAGMNGLLDEADLSEEGFAEADGLDFVNFGYMMGTCTNCEAE